MDNTEYYKLIDIQVRQAIEKIIVHEQRVERLMKGKASDSFLNELIEVVDKHSSLWTGDSE